MNKIIAVIKDLISQSRNMNEIFFAVGLAIAIMMLNYISGSSGIVVGVESKLKDSIEYSEEIGGIQVDLMGGTMDLETEFDDLLSLEAGIENNLYPLIIYSNNEEVTFRINTGDTKAAMAYFIAARYFNGVTKDTFKTEHMTRVDTTMLMLVITFALIFGGMSRGSTVLFQENDGTLNLLYKSGLNSFQIILAKVLFTLIVMLFILLCLAAFGYTTSTVNLLSSYINSLMLIFIMIPVSIMGNFVGIIANTVEESRSLQLFLSIPAIFYLVIVDYIPREYQFLLNLHPGIAVTRFYQKLLDGHFDATLFASISLISMIMFAVNVMILKKFVEKAT